MTDLSLKTLQNDKSFKRYSAEEKKQFAWENIIPHGFRFCNLEEWVDYAQKVSLGNEQIILALVAYKRRGAINELLSVDDTIINDTINKFYKEFIDMQIALKVKEERILRFLLNNDVLNEENYQLKEFSALFPEMNADQRWKRIEEVRNPGINRPKRLEESRNKLKTVKEWVEKMTKIIQNPQQESLELKEMLELYVNKKPLFK